MSGTAGFCLPTGCVILNRFCAAMSHLALVYFPTCYLSRFIPLAVKQPCAGVCNCVCVRLCLLFLVGLFQVKLLLYNHGCVSSTPAHHCTRIPASDIDPRPLHPSQHTHIDKHIYTSRVIILYVSANVCVL